MRLAQIVALTLALLAVRHLSAQCANADCVPSMRAGCSVNGDLTVAFYDNFSSMDRYYLGQGLAAWNAFLDNQGSNHGFSDIGNNPGAAIGIYIDPTLSGSGVAAKNNSNLYNNGTSNIRLNPDILGNPDLVQSTIMHELGHSLCFNDVTVGSCYGNTVMYSPTSLAGPFYGSIPPCDQTAVNACYPPPPPPGSGGGGFGGVDPCNWCDPLVLDLNGDGIQTTDPIDGVLFDLNGDGISEQMAWTNAATEEAFLYLDRDHKGRAENGSELFGVGTVMPDGTKGRDGFTALAMYDAIEQGGNADGVIDAQDSVWNRLRLWVDRNHNGICEPSETGPIHEFGVIAIDLNAIRTNDVDGAGNVHQLQSVYFRHVTGKTEQRVQTFAIHAIAFRRAAQ